MTGWAAGFESFEWPAPPPKADLGLWRDEANKLFAAGCEAQSFALLASFAAPLMPLWRSTHEGGGIVSLHGGRRAGKSVALAAAASVWGKPELLELKPATLGRIAQIRHLPVIATSLASRDPVVLRRLLTDFLAGAKEKPWQTVLISAGGEALGKIIDCPMVELALHVPRGLIAPDKQVPSVMERKLVDNRGVAGAAFLAALHSDGVLNWGRKMLASRYAHLVDATGCDMTWRFHLRTIAAAWVGGDIAVRAGLVEASPERIARWAAEAVLPERKRAEAGA